MRSLGTIVSLAILLSAAAVAAQGSGRLVTLAEALETARKNQPALAAARANTRAAEARAKGARAPLLPQVNANASYSRMTHNVDSPAVQGTAPDPSFDTVNYFSVGASASQLVWDFRSKLGRYRAAQTAADAQREGEASADRAVLFAVRAAFLAAVADRAYVGIAAESLAAQERHFEQVSGFVAAGARPEIDLAQLRADVANARLALVKSETAYAEAKAGLNQAMGVPGPTDYDVASDEIAPIGDEGASEEALVAAAEDARPELKALATHAEAIRRQIAATKGDYWPILGVSTGVSDAGTEIQDLSWNWYATASLTWPIFQGGVTRAAVQELEAEHLAAQAEIDALKLAIRTDVAAARLAIDGAKAQIAAAEAVVESRRETLRLAEARYQAGAGSIIELQDAQTALTNAEAQAVQAALGLSLARARLLAAIGTE